VTLLPAVAPSMSGVPPKDAGDELPPRLSARSVVAIRAHLLTHDLALRAAVAQLCVMEYPTNDICADLGTDQMGNLEAVPRFVNLILATGVRINSPSGGRAKKSHRFA